MSFRDTILQNVRNNQPSYRELPAIPKFHSEQPVHLKKTFTEALKELSGEVVTEPPADFETFLRKRFPDAKVICSTVLECRQQRARRLHSLVGRQQYRCDHRARCARRGGNRFGLALGRGVPR